jgi:hypothetical protein
MYQELEMSETIFFSISCDFFKMWEQYLKFLNLFYVPLDVWMGLAFLLGFLPVLLNHVMIACRLIERARRTVRGSADDIGWLQRASGMPSVEDGTGRFMEILDNIRYIKLLWILNTSNMVIQLVIEIFSLFTRHGLHKLPNSIVYLLVPGSNFYVE